MLYSTFMTIAMIAIFMAFLCGPSGMGILLAGAAMVSLWLANQAIPALPASQQTITVKAKVIR